MQFFNMTTQTTPMVIHANGGRVRRNNKTWELMKSERNKFVVSLHPDLTIVTYNNKSNSGILQDVLKNNNVPLVVANVGRRHFNFMDKFEGVLKEIENIKTNYLMFCDCYDVIINGDLRLLDFNLFKEKVVFSAERGNQRRIWKRNRLMHISDWEKGNHLGHFKHLNSGCYIGPKEVVKKFLEECVLGFQNNGINDDQIQARLVNMTGKYSYIDQECKIFQSLAYCGENEIEIKQC